MNKILAFKLPGAMLLAGGTILALESAATAIGWGPAHHTLLGNVYSPFDGAKWLGTLNFKCLVRPADANMLNPHHLRSGMIAAKCHTPSSVIWGIDRTASMIFGSGLASFAGLNVASMVVDKSTPAGRRFGPVRYVKGDPAPVVIEIGRATGILKKLGHESGIAKGECVRFVGEDLNFDTIALGGKGSGKSTCVLNPMLLQSLSQDCGALIFNVKGDVDKQAIKIAERAGRKVRVFGIGEGAEQMNLLDGLTPEMSAAFISSLLLLTGNSGKDATFWNATASNLSRAVLGLLSYLDGCYSLPGLYHYIFVKRDRVAMNNDIVDLVKALRLRLEDSIDEAQRTQIERDLVYIAGCNQEIANFAKQTEQIRSGAHSQLNQILAKMVVPELENAFFQTRATVSAFKFEDLYETGEVVVINCPLQEYGLAAASIMCFAKLRFYVTMEQRRIRYESNQTRQVGLFIDEAHEISAASQEGMSDHKFLAMSRDTGTFCVFATQSISALNAKIGEEMTKALLANLRQRILFRTEDAESMDRTIHLLGQVESDRETKSSTRQPGSWFKSKGVSVAPSLHAVANPTLIRNLKRGQALALLSIDGESADDVIDLTPVYA